MTYSAGRLLLVSTVLFVLVAPLVTPVAAFSQADRAGCEVEPSVAAVLDQVGEYTELYDLPDEARQDRLDLVERALVEHPDDLFLHRRRQDLYRTASKDRKDELLERIRQEYTQLRDSHPDDPRYHYLLARIVQDVEVEREAAEAAVELDPEFAWGHLLMVSSILRAADGPLGAEQQKEARTHLARFMELCPSQPFGGLVYSDRVGDAAFWNPRIPEIRARLREAPGDQVRAFSLLWKLEFQLAGAAEHGKVRERVAEDAAALAALGSERRPFLEVLKEGYKLAGMAEKATEVEARMRELSPCSRDVVFATLEQWDRQDEAAGDAGVEGASEVDWRSYEEATRRWIATCPEEYMFWITRLRALDHLDGSDPQEIVSVGNRAADLYGQFRGRTSPSGFDEVAGIFVDRGVALDRVGDLLDKADAEAEQERVRGIPEDFPEELRRKIERGRAYSDVGRSLLRARSAALRGELEAARGLLDEVRDRLVELDPGDEEKGRERLGHGLYESALWAARADLAEAEGRLPDAVADLLRAEAASPADLGGRRPGPAEGEARHRAVELWTGLGGTEEGLAVLEGTALSDVDGDQPALADYTAWEPADGLLPAFELTDVSGTVWKAEALKGKTVFASAWATWCGPCQRELRAVQALQERFQGRDDVLVLTLNMDENPGVVAPYMTEKGFTFPALLAIDYLRQELGVAAIPESWILDATLRRRFVQQGFDSTTAEADWIADVEERMGTLEGASQ